MDTTKDAIKSAADQVMSALSTHSDRVVETLKQGGLVPGPASKDGLIPEDFKSQTKLEVSFNGKVVELGNFFRASDCKVAPSVSFQREVSKSLSQP